MANEKITKQGKKDLEERLHQLVSVEKPKVMEDLNLARSQGDLSENADYDAAREKLQTIETEISRIQYTLDHATIIEEVTGGDRICKIGGERIHTTNLSTGKTYSFVIVGSAEAKPSEGKRSRGRSRSRSQETLHSENRQHRRLILTSDREKNKSPLLDKDIP